MQEMSGFTALPVSYENDTVHYMYIKIHASSNDDATYPINRTLFVVNVPPDTTSKTLRDLFRKAGSVESIYLHNVLDSKGEDATVPAPGPKQGTGPPDVEPLPSLEPTDRLLGSSSSAHVVFLDTTSLERAIRLPKRFENKPHVWKLSRGKDERLIGVSYMIERFRRHRPPHEAIKKHADSAIARYSWIRSHPQWLMEQRARGDTTTSLGVGIKAASVGENGELLDEDGFVIVQRGNKYGRSGGEDNTFAAITPEFEEELRQHPEKKKSKELTDFYRFQFREKKRQRTFGWILTDQIIEFASLRAQFEADKKKIAQRKASFRFKPYVLGISWAYSVIELCICRLYCYVASS